MSLSNGLGFPEVDACVLALTDIEERLVAPRIPFIRIRSLKYDKIRWDKQQGKLLNHKIKIDSTNYKYKIY